MRSPSLLITLILAGFAATARTQATTLPTFVTAPEPRANILVDSLPSSSANGVADALRLSNGRIAAAYCGVAQVRIFDTTGAQLFAHGKPSSVGRGFTISPPPDEYQTLRRLFRAGGDTLAAVDGAASTRVTLLAPNATVVRTFPVSSGGGPNTRIDVIGRLTDGTFIGRRRAQPPADTGWYRPPVILYRIGPTGQLLDSLTTIPGNEVNVVPARMASTVRVRLGRSTETTVLPDRVVVGTQDKALVTEYGGDLRPLRTIETITKPAPVTEADRSAWVATAPTLIPRGGVGSVFGTNFATDQPAYRELATGTDGRLWVQDPYRPGVYPLVWTAYQNQRAVARVEVPPRFHPTEFGPDWVLGVGYDDTNVARIQLLSLRPGPLTGRTLTPRDAQAPNPPRCGPWMSR
jgi:hypothetical protein